jgi:Putative regulator of cell autolysis
MWMWWGAVALGLWLAAHKYSALMRFSLGNTCLHLFIGTSVVALHLFCLQLTLHAGFHWQAWRDAYSSINYLTLSRFGAELMIYGFIYGTSGALYLETERKHQAIEKLELEKQLSEAHLHTLQMQMEPHFLFNTLNALSSLVVQGRNEEASQTLIYLNNILRATLQRRAPEKVPFTEELRILESYLSIQRVRFMNRLEIKIDASEDALSGMIPCFLLQPLVENAIQHGIAPMTRGGRVETTVRKVGNHLWMRVKDNGRGFTAGTGSNTKGNGIGLRNVRERLAHFYPGCHSIEIGSPSEGGFEITIQIPFERYTS